MNVKRLNACHVLENQSVQRLVILSTKLFNWSWSRPSHFFHMALILKLTLYGASEWTEWVFNVFRTVQPACPMHLQIWKVSRPFGTGYNLLLHAFVHDDSTVKTVVVIHKAKNAVDASLNRRMGCCTRMIFR